MKLKIGILGTRGIPNHYGGFEHISEYVSAGLVSRGHEVTVYNTQNHPYQESTWNGVQIVHCYDPEFMGAAGQFIYDLNCLLDARKRDFEFGAAYTPKTAPLSPIWTDWSGSDPNTPGRYKTF
jgi:hypothetical protein